MTTGRRGRPYQVPDDKTAIGSTGDLDARVGWLLLMSRLHHGDRDLAYGEIFNNALRGVDLHADRSAVSRWESGKVTPRYPVVESYEHVLGLPAGQLTSVVNAYRGELGLPPYSPRPNPIGSADPGPNGVDAMFEAALGGYAAGHIWISLARQIASAQIIYIQADAWRAIAHNLVSEAARSVGSAYLQRVDALRLLLGIRAGQRWVLEAVERHARDSGIDLTPAGVTVLEIASTPRTSELLLDNFLDESRPANCDVAAVAIARKLRAGGYAEDVPSIEKRIHASLTERATMSANIAELIAAMPEPARSRLMRVARLCDADALLASFAQGELVAAETARRVAGRIADRARDLLPSASLYDDDKMTPRLVREALFSGRSRARTLACLTLLASPFRTHLAAALVSEIRQWSLEDPSSVLYAGLLRFLATPDQADVLVSWLSRAPSVLVQEFTMTLGQLGTDGDLGEVVRLLGTRGPYLDSALMYCLGMRQAPILAAIASGTGYAAATRRTARAWIDQGGVVLA